jgi:hypothetical protein
MSSRPLPSAVPDEAGVGVTPAPDASAAALVTSQAFAELHCRLVAGGYVEYRPVLAELFGGPKPALMLGHALYWTRTWLRQQRHRDGWFWKTAQEWREAVGLSTREQESARQALRDSGVMSEALQGSPARLFFRVNIEELCGKLGLAADPDADDKTVFDRLNALLGQPVMFFRPLADIAGGVIGGLVLSHLMDRYRMALARKTVDALGFFTADVEDARIALSLGAKAQRNARDGLRKAGLIQEAWTAEKRPRLMVRLNMQAILACLCGQDPPKRPLRGTSGSKRTTAPEAVPVQGSLLDDRARVVSHEGNVTRVTRLLMASGAKTDARRRLLLATVEAPAPLTSLEIGESRQSSLAHLSKQQGLSSAKGGPFVETRVALLSKLYTKPSISKTTTTDGGADAPTLANEAASSSRSLDLPFDGRQSVAMHRPPDAAGLVLPDRLDPVLHAGAIAVVERAPAELQQALLDELAGRLGSGNRPLGNPLGWLAALADKARHGQVVLTMAPKIAAAREARARHERAIQTLPVAVGPATQTQTDAAPSAVGLKWAAELRKRNRLRIKDDAE